MMTYDDVVAAIRCTPCLGTGSNNNNTACTTCEGNGINPEVIDEAGGWDNWAITVHDRPGLILVVPLD